VGVDGDGVLVLALGVVEGATAGDEAEPGPASGPAGEPPPKLTVTGVIQTGRATDPEDHPFRTTRSTDSAATRARSVASATGLDH
jgi:hypothetical protein